MSTILFPVFAFILLHASIAKAQDSRPPWLRSGTKVRVKIESVPVGAQVYIEDKKWGIVGTTPTNWIRLPRNNSYKVILTHPDMEDFETTLQLTTRYNNQFTYTMVRKILPGAVEFKDGGTGSSIGATIMVDGEEKGKLPSSVELKPGRYQISVTKEGFHPYTDTVTIEERSTRVLMVNLLKIEEPKGRLLVTADMDNAEVEVDRESKGRTPVLLDMNPGNYLVVVKFQEFRYQQIVEIKANQTAKVLATLKPKEADTPMGMLTVISSTPGAEVWINGEKRGLAPQTQIKLPVGQHFLEVRKTGFVTAQRTVVIKLNETVLENFELSDAPKITPMGKIKITTETDAKILLDNQLKGKGAFASDNFPAGKYQLFIEKPGFKKVQRTIEVHDGKLTNMHIPMERAGSIKVISNVPGARVIIDNQEVGRVPLLDYELPVGTYRLEVLAKGYRPYTQTIRIEGASTEPITFNINMLTLGPTSQEIAEMKSALSAFGAKVIPPQSFTASAGIDYPYWLDSRLMVGIWKKGVYGIDGGATFRTYFNMTEFLFTVRGQFFQGGPLTLGAFMDLGGGVGKQERTNFTWNWGGSATLSFREKVNLSVMAFFNIYRDRFCLSAPPGEGDPRSEPAFCNTADPDDQVQGWKGKNLRDPYWGARIMFSTAVEWALDTRYSVYVRFHWAAIPLKPSGTIYRPAYMDYYNSSMMPKNDTQFYGGAGFLWKF